MIESPVDKAVAMVKANVTDFIVAQGMRSAAAMAKDTPVTWPPSEPEDTPALIESLLVLTVMPLAFPAVAGPNVTPPRVTTYAPAAKVLPTPIDIEDVETEDTVSNRPGAVAVVGGAAVVAALVVAAAEAQENGSAVVVGGAAVVVSYHWY